MLRYLSKITLITILIIFVISNKASFAEINKVSTNMVTSGTPLEITYIETYG